MLFTLIYVLFVVIGVQYLSSQSLGSVLLIVSVGWGLYYAFVRRPFSAYFMPAAAVLVAVTVLLLNDTDVLKYYPLAVSLLFFLKFADAWLFSRPFLAKMLSRIPRLPLSDAKLSYIDASHGYWTAVTGVNALIQGWMLLQPLHIWALYSTAGWYLLFSLAVAAQIVYGKTRGL